MEDDDTQLGPESIDIEDVIRRLDQHSVGDLRGNPVMLRDLTTGKTVYARRVTMEVSNGKEFILRFDAHF